METCLNCQDLIEQLADVTKELEAVKTGVGIANPYLVKGQRIKDLEQQLAAEKARADRLQAFKDEWDAKDGNSPGYNLEKARNYGEQARNLKMERDALSEKLKAAEALADVRNREMSEVNDTLGMLDLCQAKDAIDHFTKQIARERECNSILREALECVFSNAHRMKWTEAIECSREALAKEKELRK